MPASTSHMIHSIPQPAADATKKRPAGSDGHATNGDGKHGDHAQRASTEPDELAPTEGTSTEPEDDAAKATNGRKGKKKKANRACAACQKAHLTCDDSRPCTRCVKKGIGDQCTDGKRKRAKYLLDEEELEAVKAREKAEKEEKERAAALLAQSQAQATDEAVEVEQLLPPPPPPPIPSFATMDPTQSSAPMFASMPAPEVPSSVYQPEPFAMPDPTGFPSDNTPPYTFGSEATSLEYSILSAMLNGIDPSLLSGSPDKDGLSTNAPFAEGPGGITPGASSLDLKSLFDGGHGGTNLPSVGMASDMSNHWLIDSSRPPGANPWAPNAAPSPSSFGPTSAAEVAHKALGQLHAIGGGDGNEGEVGAGGFKALEVPSPSPSLASNRLTLDSEAPGTASTPSESGKQGVGIGAPGSGAAMHPGGGPGGLHALSMLEAQWRERVNHIYGDLTRPFPYTEGYHFLLKFVTEKFEKAEVLRIVRALGLFRPSLIALQMPLTEEDEIFVERSIQRTILEFEKLISFSGTPTVVWRRTCEICVVGSEFSMLTGWSRELLIGRRIYEFWDKSSTLEYWEKFASHAFENTSQSIVVNVVLKRPDGSSVPCAACFSIKRNVFDLPSLVVGAFLPILSAS